MSLNDSLAMGRITEKNPKSPYGWEFIDDLSAVPDNENAIVEFLLHRIERQEIYTWVGPLLLAVNPKKSLIREIYDDNNRKSFADYANVVPHKLDPHIYAVAARAHYRLTHRLGKIRQAIVISGESGTGKTFNAREALNFLASTKIESDTIYSRSLVVDSIVRKIANVFPLISALTTASTKNNARSSRHGQLIRLHYDDEGSIRGARISSFLLERTRVTGGSKNFEIFYQLVAGLDDREMNELRLSRHDNYVILGDRRYSDASDATRLFRDFRKTSEAMVTLNFDENSRMNIFRVIAFLMHMGNIGFDRNNDEGCIVDVTNEVSRKAMKNACSLVSLPETDLSELLTSILICPDNSKRRHTCYRRGLRTIDDCRNRLSSVIRHLYERLFEWIVDRANASLIVDGQRSEDWLGILDIFGFESFERNGLEQLCINYTTERLQLYFMEDYLETGQRELREEGLGSLPPSFAIQIYRERLSAIESVVFTAFNDACQSAVPPCSSGFRQRFSTKDKETARFLKINNDVFVINHYSRAVAYDVDNLLSKNTDKVPTELSCVFKRCDNELLRTISTIEDENICGIGCRVATKKFTALAKLKRSLDRLLEELNKCDSHYVRCIGTRQTDGSWMKNDLREQLACTGILDAVPLTKSKFPIKFTYEEFYKRYSIKRAETNSDLLRHLGKIVNSKNINSSVLHLGKRLLFTTEFFFLQLEHHRKNHRSRCAKIIQSFWLKNREKFRGAPANTTGPRVDEIRVHSKKNHPIIVVTKTSLSSNDNDDDVFTKDILSIEDQENNNETLNVNVNPNSVETKTSKDFPVPSCDTGYGDTVTAVEKSSQPSREKIQIVDKSAQSTNRRPFRVVVESTNNDVARDIGSWKEFYLRKWLETSPNYGEQEESSCSLYDRCEQFKNRLNVKYSRNEITAKHECPAIDSNEEKFFCRNRILSRRRVVEIPIRFHTRLSCLPGSHRLPRSMKPRGLEDCLS